MRKLLVSVIAVAVLAALTAQASAAGRSVKIGDNYFGSRGTAPTIFVAKGTRVTWRWRGNDLHDVAVRKGPVKFRSSLKTSGKFRKKMRKRGTYRIVCSIHAPDMKMKLKVY